MGKISLSVIMPALNEAQNIEDALKSTLQAFEKHNVSGEIIVVNDGSTDGTREIVELFQKREPYVRLINNEIPRGIGSAFFRGVRSANNEVVVMFPGDNENDPDDVLVFLDLLNHVDIIVPFVHNIEIRNRFRRFISSLYRFIINLSFGINLNYTNGTVFYRKCILDNFDSISEGFFYQAELLITLIRKGYVFAEVPCFLSKRLSGKSKALTFKSLIRIMKAYLKVFFDIHIRRIEGARKNYRNLNDRSVTYKRELAFRV